MGTGRADARSVVAALAALAAVTLGSGGAAAAEAPVDLRTVERTGAWNDALACPPSVCRAAPDMPSPIVAVPADTLVERAVAALTREPRVELVAVDRELRQVVLVQRSAVLGFPDTIRVQAIETAGGNAVILYSRSMYGYWDFGVNRARVARWLDLILAEGERR